MINIIEDVNSINNEINIVIKCTNKLILIQINSFELNSKFDPNKLKLDLPQFLNRR